MTNKELSWFSYDVILKILNKLEQLFGDITLKQTQKEIDILRRF